MNVVEHANSYTYYLEPNIKKIYAQAFYYDVDVDILRQRIKNYIYPAAYSFTNSKGKKQYTKKKWFLEALDNCGNNSELYWLCKNSIEKAAVTSVVEGV